MRDDRLFLAHVGDCRAYRWNAAGLEQLTTDHSVIASMIASGQAQPEEIYTHPHRSVIYRCIGDKPAVGGLRLGGAPGAEEDAAAFGAVRVAEPNVGDPGGLVAAEAGDLA